jgi:type I restriction enzyme S subunit
MIEVTDFPSHWRIVPAWSIYERVKRTGNPDKELLSVYRDYGVIPKSSRDDNHNVESEDLSSYQLVQAGDLVVNKMKAWQGSFAVSDFEGIVSPAYFVYKSKHRENSRFLHYLLRSAPYMAHYNRISSGVRIGQWDLDPSQFRVTGIGLPPRSEQDAIVEFLDQELQEINTLQDRNIRLLEQLALRRESLISSFIEDKSRNWPWVPLKYEIDLNPEVLPEDTDPSKILNYIEIGDVSLEQGITGYTPVAFSEAPSRARRLVRNGDVLISTVRTYLKAVGQVREIQSEDSIVASTGFAVLRPNRIEPRFLKYAVSSDSFIQNIQAYSTGISYPAINASQLVKFKIPVPPIALQAKIADELDNQMADLDKLKEKTEGLVATLQERRLSLVSSVVTGKIDLIGRA